MESYDDYIDNCTKSLASYGWTFPVNLSPGQIENLVTVSHDRLDVDKFFIEHYSNDLKLFKMFNSVYSADLYDKWYKLIEQCIRTYKSGLYLVTVPALITVIEGAIANLSSTTNTGIIDLSRKRAENMETSSVPRYLWNSFYYFALQLYENKSFDKERPQLINRHWILHGRDSYEWNQADCLRIFQALYTLESAEIYNQQPLKRKLLRENYIGEGNIL
jgi:hypothetical protein